MAWGRIIRRIRRRNKSLPAGNAIRGLVAGRRAAFIAAPLLIAVISLLGVVLLTGAPCFARDNDDIRTLEVEGTGSIAGGDFSRGRSEAIRAALRRAVAAAAVLWLPAGLPVQEMQAVSEALDARAEGYIQDYRIIAEKPLPTLYTVVVRATVSVGNIKKDLQALGFLKTPQPGNATVLVRLTISGLASYADYGKLKNLLRTGLGGVQSLSERQMAWKTAWLDLRITGTAKSLAAELASKSPLPLDITKVEGDSIAITVLN
jgi:hypothetical protein